MEITRIIEKAKQMMQRDEPPVKILNHLALSAERFIPKEEVCSILVLDKNGVLRNGASPRLPSDYLAAIDRIKPNPNIGTCAAAAATGEIVITPSFLADSKWSELKHLPMAIGFVGAWSMPIKSADGKVLGTFGTYFKRYRTPSEEEISSIGALASVAADVLSRNNVYA